MPAASSPGGEVDLGEFAQYFSFLSADQLSLLQPHLSCREYRAGEVVMRDSELGDFMGFLVGGKLAVRKETIFPGRHVLMAFLEPGALVGEVAGVSRCQRNTTVVAVEASRLLVLTTDNLERLLATAPALGITLLQRIIAVLGTRLHCATDRLARLL